MSTDSTSKRAKTFRSTADPNVRAMYVHADDEVFRLTSVSIAVIDGCTSPHAEVFDGVMAEKLVNDLHTDFPPPYTLEIQ